MKKLSILVFISSILFLSFFFTNKSHSTNKPIEEIISSKKHVSLNIKLDSTNKIHENLDVDAVKPDSGEIKVESELNPSLLTNDYSYDISPKIRDYSNSILENKIMQLVNSPNANFHRSQISGSTVVDSELSSSIFDETSLLKSTFSNVNLFNSVLTSSNLKEVLIERSQLSRADFELSKIEDSAFNDVELYMANFTASTITNVKFDGTNLHLANFRNSILKNVDFSKSVNLETADFSGAILCDCLFPSGEISKCDI